MLTKDEYLLKNFSKIKHKKWELFVITRILHLLDDPDIEYVCQQYIKVKGNKHYLTDLCFPSLKLYYEIDEGQHGTEKHLNDDKIRQREILEATDWVEKRVKVFDSDDRKLGRNLDEVIQEVDKFIEYVKKRKQEFEKKSGKKITWDYKNKFNPKKYLNSGSIDVKDNVVLLNHKDCLKLFGYKSNGHFQQAWWDKGTKNLNQAVWFPKLYPNKEWDNSLSLDSQTITEQKKINGKVVKIGLSKETRLRDRIVFAHYKNIFGQTVYKFYGIYETDKSASNEYEHIHRRIKTKINLKNYLT
jgi:very-short-patch-repair endonuclease